MARVRYIKFIVIHLDFVKIQEIYSSPHKDMSNMEYFVQIFIGSLDTAAACSVLLSAYLSVAWLPFREKMEERYHHHNQLKKLTHMGTKTKETPMHSAPPPPPLHTGKVNHHHKNKDGLAKLQTLAWPRWCWRGHKRT